MKQQMLKTALLSLLLASAPAVASAAGEWTIQGATYSVDTLYHAKIGPGTTQTSLRLTGANTLNIFYTTTDMSNPYVDFRVTKGANKLTGCNTLSAMEKGATREGALYFAGVNADFFGGSRPIGSTVVDSEVYYAVNNSWACWYMDTDRRPGISTPGFKGSARSGQASHALTGINADRGENHLVIYNKRRGANTGTNIYGSEVLITPVEGALAFRGSLKCRVSGSASDNGSMAIPADGSAYVLSGNGSGAAFVKGLAEGSEVEFSFDTETPGCTAPIFSLAGGQPVILSGGEVLNTQGAIDHLVARHPRTAIGHDAEGSKVVMLVVDGRTTVSVGVVSKALAEIMRYVGCSEAMNFDGGGSTELYTTAFGVRNHPSDGKERAVTNAVWAVATSPTDNEIAEIAFANPSMVLPRYGYFKPLVYGYNKYGVLLTTELEGVTVSCDEALGQVVDNGSTLFANGSGTHALTAHYGKLSAKIAVTIGTADPCFKFESVVLDEVREYPVEVVAMVEGREMKVDNSALTWTTSDPSVASVDDAGVVKGLKNGKATVEGRVDNISESLAVNVEIPATRYVPLVSDSDPSEWTVTKTGMSSAELSAAGKGGFAVDYKISNLRSTSVTVKRLTPVYSIPDSLRVVINPGNAKITKVTLNMGVGSERPTAVSYTPEIKAGEACVLLVSPKDFIDASYVGNYPLMFTSIAFTVGGSVGDEARIEVPEIDAVFTRIKAGEAGLAEALVPGREDLLLTPGAVATGEDVRISGAGADAVYSVFAPSGVCVARGRGEVIATRGLSSGVYAVSVAEGGVCRSARLVVR